MTFRTPPLPRTSRAPVGRLAPWRVGVRVAAPCALLIALAACATVALPEGDGAPSIQGGPGDGQRLTTDTVAIAVDPGEWRGVVTALVVEAYDERDAASPARSWSIETVQPDLAFDLPLDGLEDGLSYRFQFALVHRSGARFPLDDTVRVTLDLGLPTPTPRWMELPTMDRRQPFAWDAPSSGAVAGALVEYRLADGAARRVSRDAAGTSVAPSEDLVSI